MPRIQLSSGFFLALTAFVLSVNAQSGSCDSITPFYTVDMSAAADATWTSPSDSREGNCCGTSFPDRCVEFEVTLHPGAIGLSFEIASGAAPSGSLFYQVGCGPPVAVGDPICLADAGPHTLTFCKPGANPNAYRIVSIPGAIQSPEDTVKPGCDAQMVYAGYNLFEDSIVWRDITSGTGFFEAYLDCTSGCDTVTFSPPFGTSVPFVDFEVCGIPNTGACTGNFGNVCDTFRMYIIPPVSIAIDPIPAVLCPSDSALTLYAVPDISEPSLIFQWFSGDPLSGSPLPGENRDSLVVTAGGVFSVVVVDTLWPACSRDTATATVLAPPPFGLVAGPDTSICAGQSIALSATGGLGHVWTPSTGLSCTSCPDPIASPSANTAYTVQASDVHGCLESDTVSLTVHPSYAIAIPLSVCNGDSVFIAGAWQSSAGTYVESNTTAEGCDSVRTYTLSIVPGGIDVFNYTVCPGDSILLPTGDWALGAGTWVDTLSSTGSCHQVAEYVVQVRSAIESTQYFSICQGDSVALPGGQWTGLAGTYSDTFATASGCDSILNSVVQVLPAFFLEQTQTLCSGDSLLLPGGDWISTPGVYTDTLGSTGPCHEIVQTTVASLPSYTSTEHRILCPGDSVLLPNGSWAAAAGTYHSHLSTWQGCDSIISVELSMASPFRDTLTYSGCPGDSISLPGYGWAYAPGFYSVSGSTSVGCDSTVVHALAWLPSFSNTLSVDLCSGDSMLLPVHGWTTAPAVRNVLFSSAAGCDSSVRYELYALPAYRRTDSLRICPGDSVVLPSGVFAGAAGTYVDSFATAAGCDSIWTTVVAMHPTPADTVMATLCAGDAYLLPGGGLATTAGWFRDTLNSLAGCDSVVHTLLSLTPSVHDSLSHRICPGDSVLLPNGQWMGTAFAGTFAFTAASGCDSFVYAAVELDPSFVQRQSLDLCNGDSLRLPGGDWVFAGGVYTDTLSTGGTCDSIWETTVLVYATWEDSVEIQICSGDFYTLPGGTTANTSGFYTDTLISTGGCDSIITTELIVGPILYTFPEFRLCAGDSLLLPSGLWTSTSGTYSDTLVSDFGCDSIIETTVVVAPLLADTIEARICAGASYPLPGGGFASSNGSYTGVLTGSSGCDSLVTLLLTVDVPIGDTLNVYLCPGDSILLPDATWASTAGVYDVLLSAANGCDSFLRTVVLPSGGAMVLQDIALCPGDSVLLPGGSFAASAGIYTDTILGAFACDSIVQTTISLDGTWLDTLYFRLCPGESVLLPDGSSTATAGIYRDTLGTAFSCDSVVISIVDVLSAYASTDTLRLCQGDSVFVLPFGWLSAEGMVVDSALSTSGCDSIRRLQVLVDTAYVAYQYLSHCPSDSVLLLDGTWTSGPGSFTFTLPSASGCDSVIHQQVAVWTAPVTNLPVTVCAPDSALLPGYGWVDSSGIYSYVDATVQGCDSIVRYHVLVVPNLLTDVERSICFGDSVRLPDSSYVATAGVYTNAVPGTAPCPIMIRTTVVLDSILSFIQHEDLCEGDSLLLPGGLWTSSAGLYRDTLLSAAGCDSVITTTIDVWQDFLLSATERLCDGDSVLLSDGRWVHTPGIYYDTLSAYGECAAVLRTDVVLDFADTTYIQLAICANDSVQLPDGSWTDRSGTYIHTFSPLDRCDSTVVARVGVGPDAELLVDSVICRGDSAYLGYAWQTTTGLYTDTIWSPLGCPILRSTSLQVVDQVLVPPHTVLCPGDSALLSFLGPGPFYWSPPEGLSCTQCSETMASPTQSTTYQVVHPSCPSGWDTTDVQVSVLPEMEVDAGPDLMLIEGTPVTLQASSASSGSVWFSWSEADSLLCTSCPEWSFIVEDATWFSVEGIDANGCRDADTLWVQVDLPDCPIEGLAIPNALSPNADGKNDAFVVRLDEPEQFLSIEVYNRWGEQMFFSTDPAFAWDGRFRGKLVDPGVFVYYLRYRCPSGGEKALVGNVTLLR